MYIIFYFFVYNLLYFFQNKKMYHIFIPHYYVCVQFSVIIRFVVVYVVVMPNITREKSDAFVEEFVKSPNNHGA